MGRGTAEEILFGEGHMFTRPPQPPRFHVVFETDSSRRVAAIKALRAVLRLSLKEARALVDLPFEAVVGDLDRETAVRLRAGLQQNEFRAWLEEGPGRAAGETVAVELQRIGEKQIQAIVVVRRLTGLGLKETKDTVHAAAGAPVRIPSEISRRRAERLVDELRLIDSEAKIV